jgi:hypothetical protein
MAGEFGRQLGQFDTNERGSYGSAIHGRRGVTDGSQRDLAVRCSDRQGGRIVVAALPSVNDRSFFLFLLPLTGARVRSRSTESPLAKAQQQ